MKYDEIYEGMGHTVRKGFGVKRVFGEPIKINDEVTIIPVAKVKMSGGGGGGEEMEASEASAEGEVSKGRRPKGQGGGFGFMGGVKPVGYIKVKGSCVKFHRIHDCGHIAKMMVPVCVIVLAVIKHKMMHFKQMGYGHGPMPMGHMAGPCGHGMMHKHGHMYPGHGHMHGACGHKMMMKGKGMKPEDWRAKKKEWKKGARA